MLPQTPAPSDLNPIRARRPRLRSLWPKPRLDERDVDACGRGQPVVLCRVQYFPRIAKLDVVHP